MGCHPSSNVPIDCACGKSSSLSFTRLRRNVSTTEELQISDSLGVEVVKGLPVIPFPEANGTREIIGQIKAEQLAETYDLVVIGGGPAGVAAALKAACLGRRALVLDKPKIAPSRGGLDVSFGGPTGLFSKALRDAGREIDVQSLQALGLDSDVIWRQICNTCMRRAAMNASHAVSSLKDFKVDYLQARATVVSATKVLAKPHDGTDVEDMCTISTRNIIIATGSKPVRTLGIPFDDKRIFDPDTINALSFLPSRVAIVGAGVVAIEYAKIFRKFNASVFMIVRQSAMSTVQRIGLDQDICSILIQVLREDDVQIYEGTTIINYILPEKRPASVRLVLKSTDSKVPKELDCDIVLAALGREPASNSLGLQRAGVEMLEESRGVGRIRVNSQFQTSVPGIYAVGDVLGPPYLASVAVHQAQSAVLSMFEKVHVSERVSFPSGMWSSPECSYYGDTRESAEARGLLVEEGVAHYDLCLRGRMFAPDGMLKLVFEKEDGVIVGVHVIGEDACELVHYGMDLVEQRVTIFELMTTVFVAVTYHELFREAAVNGNHKLAFGLQWRRIFAELRRGMEDAAQKESRSSVKGSGSTENGRLSTAEGLDMRRLRKEFESLDANGNGSLDGDELGALFESLGMQVKSGTITNLIRLADEDGNGTIEWDEFCNVYSAAFGGGFARQVSNTSEVSSRTPATRRHRFTDVEKQRFGEVPEASLKDRYELVVIGGGPAGFAGALKAASLGHRCLIIDLPRGPRGGEGLNNWYGAPGGLFSKALRDVGKAINVPSLCSMGLDVDVIWQQVQTSCFRLLSMDAEHQMQMLKEFKVDYLQAHAMIQDAQTVSAKLQDAEGSGSSSNSCIISTDNLLVATGSRSSKIEGIPFDSRRIFDTDVISRLSFLPSKVVVIGSGIIAVEFAKIFQNFGCTVTMLVRSTVMQSLERIGLDKDIRMKLLQKLRSDNVQIYEDTSVTDFHVPTLDSDPVLLELSSSCKDVPSHLDCDIVLVACGRKPNVTGFGLENVGVELATDGNHMKVDDRLQTSVPGIYAAGDVIGPPSLQATGVHQAQNAVEAIFGEGQLSRVVAYPVGMWTSPECGYYGYTKDSAENNGLEVEEGVASYDMCWRGRIFAPEGMIKLVFKKSNGVIVGIHVIGADACELVHYGMGLVLQQVSIFSLMSTVFAAVTYHELFKEAAVNGNFKLDFGLQWHKILQELEQSFSFGEEDRKERVWREFQAIDLDANGSLDADELGALLEKLGFKVNCGTVSNLIRLADEDGSGTIDWDEFWKICQKAFRHESGKPGSSETQAQACNWWCSPKSSDGARCK
mmetsp:Transcript_43541/g.81797  ORF Transcript_43541/g.81797 Transcript_43541/m.81797 type:complete len:1313 (+) Transcript_43541:99-4037(+)